ncbi:MAG: DUF362 domain-containing protein [Chloroflexota bacterium]|nr:DUF362 domain-containing protein [Chloroflexota bacterium]
MTKEHNQGTGPRPQGIPRREFIKLAAVAGLLAGCRPVRQPEATPTSAPTDTPSPMPSPAPTSTPTTTPTTTPTATPTVMPTVAPPPEPGKVVRARHAGVWDGDTLVPEAIHQMLDGSITALTGLNDATAAWASLFDPGERIAIKVNAFRNSVIWTHVPLVMAVTECLQKAGVPGEQIVIFDYYTSELKTAGYPLNQDGPGVRCYGTDSGYTSGWQIVGSDIQLSDVLLGCDALINIPILKSHTLAGISFAMKNHYGTLDKPSEFHYGAQINRGMAELNALPPIKNRTRLIIGDILEACLKSRQSYPYWRADMTGDSIFMSFDPVAHDTAGLELFSQLLTDAGRNPGVATRLATPWLENGAELGLGINDPDNIELVEVNLG